MKQARKKKPVDPAGQVPVVIEAERRDPKAMARRKAQADQDRQSDQRCMADAIRRFDEFLRTTSKEKLDLIIRDGEIQTHSRDDKNGYLILRRVLKDGFISAWPVAMKMLDAETEVRRCWADGLNMVRRLDKVVPVTEPARTSKRAVSIQSESDEDYIFRRDGDVWKIRFEGKDLPSVKRRKGMIYIRELLSRPGDLINVLELNDKANPPPPDALDRGHNPERLKIAAHYGTGGSRQVIYSKETKITLENLKNSILSKLECSDLSPLERDKWEDDLEKVEKALREKDVIAHKGGIAFEEKNFKNARSAVADAINQAIKSIKTTTGCKALVQHFNSIRKGNACVYTGGRDWLTD